MPLWSEFFSRARFGLDGTGARYSLELGRRMYARIAGVFLAVGSFGYFSYWSDCTLYLVIEPRAGISEVRIDQRVTVDPVQNLPWGKHTISWQHEGIPHSAEFTNAAGDNYLYIGRIPPYLSVKGNIQVHWVQ